MEEETCDPIGFMTEEGMYRIDGKCDRCEMLIQFISDMERDKVLKDEPKGIGPKAVKRTVDELMKHRYGYVPKSNVKGEVKNITINL